MFGRKVIDDTYGVLDYFAAKNYSKLHSNNSIAFSFIAFVFCNERTHHASYSTVAVFTNGDVYSSTSTKLSGAIDQVKTYYSSGTKADQKHYSRCEDDIDQKYISNSRTAAIRTFVVHAFQYDQL